LGLIKAVKEHLHTPGMSSRFSYRTDSSIQSSDYRNSIHSPCVHHAGLGPDWCCRKKGFGSFLGYNDEQVYTQPGLLAGIKQRFLLVDDGNV